MMKKRTILIVIVILALILIGIYALLGGFRSFEITLSERGDYHLIGHHYAGKYDSDSLKTLFFEAKKLISEGKLEGHLTIAHFYTAEEQDSISIFVGVVVPDNPEHSPAGMEQKTIKGGKVIQATIMAHSSVRPLRTTVDKRMEAFATERNMQLGPIILEHYLSENELHIARIAE